MIGNGPEDVNN